MSSGDSGRFVRSGEPVLLNGPDAFGDHLKTLPIPRGGQSRPPVVIDESAAIEILGEVRPQMGVHWGAVRPQTRRRGEQSKRRMQA